MFSAFKFLLLVGIFAQAALAKEVILSPQNVDSNKKNVGIKLGNIKLTKVSYGAELPASIPDIIYIGNVIDKQKILAYCRKHKILSICSSIQTVKDGASLGLIASKGKVKIIIGIEGTRQEKIKWKANIYKMATLIK